MKKLFTFIAAALFSVSLFADPNIPAPIVTDAVSFTDSVIVTMSQPSDYHPQGTYDIYYSIDGTTDPNCDCSAAPEYRNAIVLKQTTTIKARAFDGNDWSPLVEVTFTKAEQLGLVYTLDYHGAQGGGNAYANTYDVTINGIKWNVPGNTTMNPARIGGKSLNGVDRVIYSKTPMADKISKIEIEHGTANDVTVNSLTVIVAADSNFTQTISTFTPEFVASGVVSVECPAEADWSNAYYKFIYNLTITASDKNKFVEFVEARFLGEGGAPIIEPDTIPATVAQAVTAGMALDSMAMSFDVYVVTGFVVKSQPYNLDYKNQIWYMVDDTTAAAPATEFEAYGCTVSENGQTLQVIDGDKVTLTGKLTKYWNAEVSAFVIEISKGQAVFVEKAEGDHRLPVPTPPDTITVARAIEIAQALPEPAEAGKSTTDTKEYIVKGFAVQVYDQNPDNTWSFYMADEADAYGEFMASSTATDANVVKNDYMYVKGNIAKRKTNAGKIQLQIYKGTGIHGEAPQGIENIELTEKAQKVIVDGVVYIVRDNKMFNIHGAQVR